MDIFIGLALGFVIGFLVLGGFILYFDLGAKS